MGADRKLQGQTRVSPESSLSGSIWRLAAWSSAFFVIALLHVLFATYFTGELFQPEWLGTAYDSLAKSLLDLRADVEQSAIKWEACSLNGKLYMYFGPFPALLRMIPNALWPDLYGLWSRSSCLAASLLCVLACSSICSQALRSNPALNENQRWAVLTISILGFGLGSPILYLVSCARIYHEAVIWGLCWELWGLYFLLLIHQGALTPGRLALLSACAAAAFHSRVTFGFPVYLILLVVLLERARPIVSRLQDSGQRASAVRETLGLALALSPAILGVIAQLAYNAARYGSIFPYGRDCSLYMSRAKIEAFGGRLNPWRIPSALFNYFGLRADYISPQPPYFHMRTVRYFDEAIFSPTKEETFSLAVSSPWLLIPAMLGALWLFRKRGSLCRRMVFSILLAQALVVSSYFLVTQRFSAEFLPLLSYAYAHFLGTIDSRGRSAAALIWFGSALVFFSALASMGSALDWALNFTGPMHSGYRDFLRNLLFP